jgi:hypothetical protein
MQEVVTVRRSRWSWCGSNAMALFKPTNSAHLYYWTHTHTHTCTPVTLSATNRHTPAIFCYSQQYNVLKFLYKTRKYHVSNCRPKYHKTWTYFYKLTKGYLLVDLDLLGCNGDSVFLRKFVVYLKMHKVLQQRSRSRWSIDYCACHWTQGSRVQNPVKTMDF